MIILLFIVVPSAEAIFTQPDPTIQNPYNPQSLNRYSFALNNPYKYIDPDGKEPVRAQAGTADQVYSFIKSIEANNPKLTANEVLNQVAKDYFKYESNAISNQNTQSFSPNFIYTSEKGVVDLRHFFNNAVAAQYVPNGAMRVADFIVEEYQCRFGSVHSCYTYEDILSNEMGREFGRGLTDDKSLSEQFKGFASSSGSGNFPTWLWNTMPQNENVGAKPPEWKQNKDYGGKALPGVQLSGGRSFSRSGFSKFIRGIGSSGFQQRARALGLID